jgi:hypothetical protein
MSTTDVLPLLHAVGRHVEIGASEACWESSCATDKDGYGRIRIGRKSYRAPRLAWLALVGPIPDGYLVLHTCDNRLCCNPVHLRLGTQADNIRECSERGRHAKRKMYCEQVNAAREMRRHGATLRQIGRELGVDHKTVFHALKENRRAS